MNDINSNDLKRFLDDLVQEFPYPEGFKGSHCFTLNRETGRLTLSVCIKHPFKDIIHFQSIIFDESGDLLFEELPKIKEMIKKVLDEWGKNES